MLLKILEIWVCIFFMRKRGNTWLRSPLSWAKEENLCLFEFVERFTDGLICLSLAYDFL